MIIELVDQSRLLILLAREDMATYGLSYDQLDWQDPHSRGVIRAILAVARRQTGFCAAGKRLLIEATPGGNGCLILVTLLEEEKRKQYRVKRPREAERTEVCRCACVYEFQNAEDMLSAIGRLYQDQKRSRPSRLLLSGQRYHLVLYGDVSAEEELLLAEYGRLKGRGAAAAAAASEHGRVLADGNAVETVGSCLCG